MFMRVHSKCAHQVRPLLRVGWRRDQREAALIDATDRVKTFELLSTQAAALAVAKEQVRVASAEVERIRRIGADVETAERTVTVVAVEVNHAGEALQVGFASGPERSRYALIKLAYEHPAAMIGVPLCALARCPHAGRAPTDNQRPDRVRGSWREF